MAVNVFTDGASRGNPGHAGAGFVIYEDGNLKEEYFEYLGKKTNNEAEYLAVLRALSRLEDIGIGEVNFFCDSEFLVKQLSGKYKVKSEKIIPLYEMAINSIEKFDKVNFNWIPRKDNTLADSLANKGIDEGKQNGVLSENLILDKSFFGKINCLKIQMSKTKDVYFHMGLLDNKVNSWNWEKVKMNEIEIGELINLLRKDTGSCSFFHVFGEKKTQIWCNKSEKSLSVRIDKVSKNMSIGESEVMRVILEECVRRKMFD